MVCISCSAIAAISRIWRKVAAMSVPRLPRQSPSPQLPQMMSAPYLAEITEKLIHEEEAHGETHEAEDRDEARALLTVSEPRTS
jgi:hypothetical protein